MSTCFLIGSPLSPDTLSPLLDEAIERHIAEYGVTEFVVGRYGRFDQLAAEALRRAGALGYDCMEVCLTADRRPGPAVGGVTDALDISGYFNRLLHDLF